MPSGKRIPSCCHHKPTGQAYVRLAGKQVYLGVYGTAESKAEYDRLIAGWLRKNDVTPHGSIPAAHRSAAVLYLQLRKAPHPSTTRDDL